MNTKGEAMEPREMTTAALASAAAGGGEENRDE